MIQSRFACLLLCTVVMLATGCTAPTRVSGSNGGSGGGSGPGGGSGGGPGSGPGVTTSPSGSDLAVTVTSPTPNQSLTGSATINATAADTSKTDGGIAFWGISDGSTLLWTDINPDSSINVNLALSQGAHDLNVTAFDEGGNPSTASVKVNSTSSGETVSWSACMYTSQGQRYQAMKMSSSATVTGVLQAEMFYGANCDPTQWTDQLNDLGSTLTLSGGGFGYTFYFIHRPDMANVSAVWTLGNQASGCVSYASAPAC